MSKLFRLFSDLQNEELLLQLQTKLCLQEYQLKGFERRMLRDLDIKNQQISQLQEQNATLKRFADAVRNSLVYRLYKGWLRPLGEIAAIKKF
jgi:hypothetical protein